MKSRKRQSSWIQRSVGPCGGNVGFDPQGWDILEATDLYEVSELVFLLLDWNWNCMIDLQTEDETEELLPPNIPYDSRHRLHGEDWH